MRHWVAYITLRQRVMIDTLQHFKMFLTLWRQDICIKLWWWCIVHHITTMRIISSHCDYEEMFITFNQRVCSSHCGIPILSRMWQYHVRMQHHGYFRHIRMTGLLLWHCDDDVMLITLWQWDYVHHIVKIWLFSSKCHDGDMFMALWW